ncbi:MAG: sulfite exporter TauE/SafE family protein [Proteobacteria bacterium]|nr:sulfite exporter TauE/SafE family protein [Pseudomonadota bacterium]
MTTSFTTDLVYGSLAAFLVGLGKGGLAAMGTFGVPIMAFAMSPLRAAAILLPVFVFSDLFALWLYRRHFSARNLRILLPAATLGIVTGWLLAARISDAGVSILVGVLGIGFCISTWRVRHRPPAPHPADVPRGTLWGVVLGFSSFVSHAGAPAFQIYVMPQRLPKQVYAGTSAITFAVVNALKLVPYAALGQLSLPNLGVSAWLLLPALAGTQLGARLVRVIPERVYYAFLQVALLVVSIELIARGIRP